MPNIKLISIDANIAAGKSTLIEKLKEKCKNIIFVLEPVDEWQEIKDPKNNVSIFQKFYEDPDKYAIYFQLTTLITRYNKLKNVIDNLTEDSTIIIERSVYTDYEVFAKTLNENGNIENVMLQIYKMYFNQFNTLFKLSKTIYLKTTPKICYDRRHLRARNGEELIELHYLENLHKRHEDFYESFLSKYPSLVIDNSVNINDSKYNENINTIIDFINN